MSGIWNRLVLWLCCLAALCTGKINTECVTGMLAAVAVSSTSLCIDRRAVRTALTVVYLLLCVPCAEFLWMAPVACYELAYRREERWLLPAFLPVLLHPERLGIQAVMFVLMFVLAREAHSLDGAQRKYHILEDEYSELRLRTERGQRETALRQDGEIRVAMLSERNRIAREIHDNVGHLLSRSLLQAGAIRAVNRQEELTEPLRALQDTLNTAMDSIRQSVHDLKDEAFDLEAMVRALESEYPGFRLNIDYDMAETAPRALKYCFAAIIREALTNTAKHSNATRVDIVLREHPALYQLLIEDNGTAAAVSDGRGMGLESMRERVESLGGTLSISAGNGFRIFAAIPRQRGPEQAENGSRRAASFLAKNLSGGSSPTENAECRKNSAAADFGQGRL
ncbi:MAG: two-component sensor histidine kinase [Lachnospiraceae bacterium]|nr:two-component sensor histidine kinase [Lachnospiraceae bacterium]